MDTQEEQEFTRLLIAHHDAQERGDYQEAEMIALQCFSLIAEDSQKNPSEKLQLMAIAHELANEAKWDEALDVRRKVLILEEAEGNAGKIFKAHYDLSHLYVVQDKFEEALSEMVIATKFARESNMSPIVVMALEGLIGCYKALKDNKTAQLIAEEAVQLTQGDKMLSLMYARALINRASCQIENELTLELRADMDVAWNILAPSIQMTFMAGYQSGAAKWWSVISKIRTLDKDFSGAAEALGKAVEFRRIITYLPHIEGPHKYKTLVSTLREYGDALTVLNETDAAMSAYEESRAILQQIEAGTCNLSQSQSC